MSIMVPTRGLKITISFCEIPSLINNSKNMVGIPQSIQESLSFDPLQFLHYLPIITSHEQILDRNFNSCPDISDIQDLLEDEFLSVLPQAKRKFCNHMGLSHKNRFLLSIKL